MVHTPMIYKTSCKLQLLAKKGADEGKDVVGGGVESTLWTRVLLGQQMLCD